MNRITKKDIRNATERLTKNAQACGLLEPHESVVYNAGNASNGIAAVLSVYTVDQTKQRSERQAYWLPRFNYAETLRTQYKAIEAASDALHGVYGVIEALRANAEDTADN